MLESARRFRYYPPVMIRLLKTVPVLALVAFVTMTVGLRVAGQGQPPAAAPAPPPPQAGTFTPFPAIPSQLAIVE